MNIHESFVDDYFVLGTTAWLRKYRNKLPAGMTPEVFLKMVLAHGLELLMVDSSGPVEYSVAMPCYLVKDVDTDPARPFIVLCPDAMRGLMLEEGRFASLREAISVKTELLFLILNAAR